MDLVVRGRLFVDGRLTETAMGIRDGVIEEIGDLGDPDLDVGESWVLPSATDIHVHLREPGYEDKETIRDGTRAAARGGVTAVYDMPNTDPPTDTLAALEDKEKRVRRRAHVDVGFYAAPGETIHPELLARAAAVKLYYSETSHVHAVAKDRVPDVLRAARDAGRFVAVHAEDPDAFTDADDHPRARPPKAERRAVEQVMAANADVGADLHIAHATLASTLEQAPSAECAPHHLLMDASEFEAHGPDVKCNPPLRDAKVRLDLWQAFKRGDALLASDHAPHTPAEKAAGAAGIPGVETMVPLMLARVARGDLPLARLVDAACAGPARRFGRAAGCLEEGREASFMVVDPGRVTRIDPGDLTTICGWTPFADWEAVFPTDVYLRGQPVVEDGDVVGSARGRVLGPGA